MTRYDSTFINGKRDASGYNVIYRNPEIPERDVNNHFARYCCVSPMTPHAARAPEFPVLRDSSLTPSPKSSVP